MRTGAQARKTAGADIRLGVSVDQVAARHLVGQTRLSSLELGCDRARQSGRCDSGYSCAYQYNLSWRDETTPMPPESDPRAAFEISVRLPHLGLRMTEHGRRALYFAERLSARGLAVGYPGLADHPAHDRLAGLMNPGYGHGGVFTLDVGTEDRAVALMEALQNDARFGFIAVSLGYFDTLMSLSAV